MGIDARVYFETEKLLTEKQVKRLSYEAGLAFGADKFMRSEGRTYKDTPQWNSPPHHNIEPITKIEQDGPDREPSNGKHLYEVHVWTRYYGEGYERGDLPFLIALAEWIDRKVPGCTVLYGGDSSGVCGEPFGPKRRSELLDHFASNGGRAYYTSENPYISDKPRNPVCELCDVPMSQFSYGPGPLAGTFYCGGCGERRRTEDGGKTFTTYEKPRCEKCGRQDDV